MAKMRARLIASIFISLAFIPIANGQLPVTDVVSQFQLVKQNLQDALAYARQGQQYLTQIQQLNQEVQQYIAFVQHPSLGAAAALINQSGLGNDLPINPAGLIGLTSGWSMNLSNLSGKLGMLGNLSNTSYNQYHIADCTDQSWACTQQKQRAYGIAGAAGFAQSAYQDLRNRMPILEALRRRAETATTPAERENIMLAWQAETAWHNNMIGQIQSAEMQARADQSSLEQQGNEQLTRNISATVASIPGG